MKRQVTVLLMIIVTACIGYLSIPSESKAQSSGATTYKIDLVHSSIYFRIMHKGLSYTYGRFNDFSGQVQIDESNHGNTSFSFSVKAASVDTNHKKRDEHLRKPDFLNARQYPTIEFKSTGIHAHGNSLHVTGDLTLHGQTKSIEMHLNRLGQTSEAIGYATEFTINRSDFGMKKMLGPVGDEVMLMISFEGTRG